VCAPERDKFGTCCRSSIQCEFLFQCLIDTSDNLKQVPDKLEGLIGDKKFLQAAVLLVSSAKTVNKPEIAVVGAVSELRAYFVSQETVSRAGWPSLCQTLTEILVEELHSHLYLKTFNSDTRWHAYTPGQTSRE